MTDDGLNLFDGWYLEHLLASKITEGNEETVTQRRIHDYAESEGGQRVLENEKIKQRKHLRSARRASSGEEWKKCFEMLELLQGSNKGMRVPNELSISIRVHVCLQCVQPDVQPVAFGTVVERLFPESPSSSAEENRCRAKLLAAGKSMELLAQLNESYPKELLTENLRKYFSSIDFILGPSFLQIVQMDVMQGRYDTANNPNTAAAYYLQLPPVEADISHPQATPEVKRKRPREEAEDEAGEEYADAEDMDAAVDAQADQRFVQTTTTVAQMSLVAQVAEAAKFSDASTVVALSAARGNLHQEGGEDPLHFALKEASAATTNALARAPMAATHISVVQPGGGTVATVQWSEASLDEIETSQDDQVSKPAPKLARMQAGMVSPLGRESGSPRDAGGSRRRNLRWSKEEEEGFKLLVNTFGVGSWKKVLTTGQAQGVIVDTRTEVDLKDKWRNMQRKEAV